MIQINNPEVLKDFNTTIAYRAQDLGLEPGEWDFVTCYGNLKIYEDYEDTATRVLDSTQPTIKLLGKEYKPSGIAKEVDPDGWQAFVELGIAFAISSDLIRKII